MVFDWTARLSARQDIVMSILSGVLATALFPFSADAAAIAQVNVTDRAITLAFDDVVAGASAFMLDGPQRIAIDVGGARPGGATLIGGPVTQLRQAQYTAQTTPVVFDLARPAVVTGGSFGEDGRSLTLAIHDVDHDGFAAAARRGRQRYIAPAAFTTAPAVARGRNSVTIPLDPPQASPPRVRISGARGTNRPLVVIDAGHGGHDPGSIGINGEREKDAALAIAKALRDELVKSGRVRVALTRSDDRFLVLGERREIARRLNADLFVSIHADSAPNPNASGATIYTLSETASDRVAAKLAARENRADVLNGVDLGGETREVSSILLDLTQRETMNVSAAFASLLQREMSPAVPFRTEYHRFAGLVVLKAPDVPSVLLETGYMSNAGDVELLFSRDYQRNIAQGARRAIETHFARRLIER
jgi:N-acetylmuramoyl-L-alanine amidase